jgi:hypothetical protein
LVRRIILTTLLASLFGCCAMGILFLFKSPEDAIYVVVLSFGNILIPTLLGVIVFQLIKNKITFTNQAKTIALRILVLVLIFALALIIWALADVIFSAFTLENVIADFNSQFLGFTPIALVLAIIIPAIDLLIDKKIKKDNNYPQKSKDSDEQAPPRG